MQCCFGYKAFTLGNDCCLDRVHPSVFITVTNYTLCTWHAIIGYRKPDTNITMIPQDVKS